MNVLRIKQFGLFILLAVIFHSCTQTRYITSDASPTYKTVVDFGAVPNDGLDDSRAFQMAIDQQQQVIIPRGTFHIENVTLKNRVEITALSKQSIIQGKTKKSILFRSSGSISNVRLSGGLWTKFGVLIKHTGKSALNTSFVHDLRLHTFDTGFDISASVGNKFYNIDFGGSGGLDNFDYGIVFSGFGGGQSNINRIVDCKFLGFRKNAILFKNTEIPKVRNSISRCWFEQGNASAIWLGNYVYGLNIEQSYFEAVGNSTHPDIMIGTNKQSSNRNIVVEYSSFQNPKDNQLSRVKTIGKIETKISDNMIMLKKGMVFAILEHSNVPFLNRMDNNYLNAIGGGKYINRLFKKKNKQVIEWTPCPGSGFVSDDELKPRK